MSVQNKKGVMIMKKKDQEFIVQKIKMQYTEKKTSDLEALKALDKKVRFPVNLCAYVFGAFSAMVMGVGMSLVMTELGSTLGIANPMAPGIVIGVIGLIMAAANYPVYKNALAKRRKEYADEIVKLSDRILSKEAC